MSWMGVLGILALGVGGCGGGDSADDMPAGVAAKVGDRVIRESVVQAQLNRTYASRGETVKSLGPPNYSACIKAKRNLSRPGDSAKLIRQQCSFEYKVDRAQAVNTLLRAEWLKREAKRRGIDTERVVRRAVDRAKQFYAKAPDQAPDLTKNLSLRMEAQWNALADITPASEQEIQEYGAANAEVYYQGESRRAQIVQTTSKARASQARKDLEAGVSWPKVQDRYGLKPFEGHWTGHLELTEHTAPHDSFGRSVFSSRRGQIIGPTRTLNGWFVFEVTAIRAPRYKKLSPQAHRIVTGTVRAGKLDAALIRRYTDQTKCAPQYVIPEAPTCH
jgi:hypothetical protein